MSKSKSVFVTAVVAVMLGIIIFAAYKLLFPAFVVIVGALSGVGFGAGAIAFCRWLAVKPEEPLEPVVTCEQDLLPEDFSATVEEIMQEVQREAVS